MNRDFTRVECSDCGSVHSIISTLDDERYRIEFCSFCGSEDIETYFEEVKED